MANSIEIVIKHRYLNLPITDKAPLHKIRFRINDQIVRYFDLEWAEGEPDFWVFTDVSAFAGETLVIEGEAADGGFPEDENHSSHSVVKLLKAIIHSDTIEGVENLYQEKHRPQFHFTSRRGWHNDPNGLVYYKGIYHLFYQHNPFGRSWGNMHWGHAVSNNLVHWKELSDEFYPDDMGTIFSGSAFVDWDNTAGLKKGLDDTLICIYTAAGEWVEPKAPYTQCLAYSVDGGQSWQKYKNNPILPKIARGTRDPKVIWHPDTKQWIMALYIKKEENREKDPHHFALFRSPNLIEWAQIQDFYFPGWGECPDFFPLPLDGDPSNQKWVYWTADGYYLVGKFDGMRFTTETKLLTSTYSWVEKFLNGYAAQTWSDIPFEDGRMIQIAWLRGDHPNMPFNQQMTFPVALSLKTTRNGPRLHFWPVKEIDELYQEQFTLENIKLSEAPTRLPTGGHDLLDISTTIDIGNAEEIELNLRGIPIVYDNKKQEISLNERKIQLKRESGKIHLRVLLDRASIELFAADGLVYVPYGVIPDGHNSACFLKAKGGVCTVETLHMRKLKSAWEKNHNKDDGSTININRK